MVGSFFSGNLLREKSGIQYRKIAVVFGESREGGRDRRSCMGEVPVSTGHKPSTRHGCDPRRGASSVSSALNSSGVEPLDSDVGGCAWTEEEDTTQKSQY